MSMQAKLFFAVLCLSFCAFNVFSQTTKGLTLELNDELGQKKNVELYTGSYALVIAASDYQAAGWNKLPGAKSDLLPVRTALEKQGFKVEELAEPTSETLLPRIRKFVDDHGLIAGNRLLIYFTGHGFTETDANSGVQYGYIVPIDAPNPSKDLIGFQQRAVSMDDIESLAKRIRSRHTLFIFDSCFSGTLISRDGGEANKFINYLTAKPVRQFITAGAADQTVPDQSIFRQAFVKGLEGDGDGNKDGYITGSELAAYLQERVIFYSKKGQTPQYGKLRDPRYDGGDFVFISPVKPATNNQPKAALPTMSAASLRQFIRWDTMIARSEYDTVQRETTAELSRNPTNILALRMRSEAFYKLNQSNQARQDAEAILRLLRNPMTAEEFQSRGFANLMFGKRNEAIGDYTKAIELNPDSVSAYVDRGGTYIDVNELDKAIADINKAIELDPKYALAYYARGGYYSRSNLDQAIADYTKAIELDPKFYLAYDHRAQVYVEKQDYTRAIADATKIIELYPNNSSGYLIRAYVYFAKKDYESALTDITKSISIDPKDVSNYLSRSRVYIKKSDYNSAISDLTKAIELAPKEGNYYDSRGEFYLDLKQYDKAITDLTKAIELSGNRPEFIETYKKRAKAYEAKGETAKAAADQAKITEMEKAQQQKQKQE